MLLLRGWLKGVSVVLSSKFELVYFDDTKIIIRDLNVGMSVTNDAENVVKYLHAHASLGDRKLYYYDSEGRFDELRHEGPKFIGFWPADMPDPLIHKSTLD